MCFAAVGWPIAGYGLGPYGLAMTPPAETPTQASREQGPTARSGGGSLLRRGLVAGAALIVVTGVVAILLLRGRTYVVELTEAQIQEKLDDRFPVRKQYLSVFALTLSEPKVSLQEGSDRISLGLKATLNIQLGGQQKPLGGDAVASAGLRYDPTDYSFYLDDPNLKSLTVQGIPFQYTELVDKVAAELAQERLDRTPIYTLRKNDLKQTTARLVLRGFVVQDGRLIITLGL